MERRQVGDDAELLSLEPALAHLLTLITAHDLEVVIIEEREAIFGPDVRVEVVVLFGVFLHGIVGVVEHERHVVDIVAIGGLPVCMLVVVGDAVVQLGIDDKTFDGRELEHKLMGVDIRLVIGDTTIDQIAGVGACHHEMPIRVIHRDDRPVTAHVVVVETVHHSRLLVVGACEAHVVRQLGPAGDLRIHFGGDGVAGALVGAIFEQTVALQEVAREIVAQALIATIDTDVVLLREAVAKGGAQPVAVGDRQQVIGIPNLPAALWVGKHGLHRRVALCFFNLL